MVEKGVKMNTATLKAILATTASIAILLGFIWFIIDIRTKYISDRSVLMQKELDAYRESLILTGKACKLDVKQLRYELRQVQAENELLKKKYELIRGKK